MTSNILTALKSSGRLSMVAIIGFFISMLVSIYLLSTLPYALVMKGGLSTLDLAWPVLIRLFISVGLTFILGVIGFNVVLQSRREVIVYLDRKRTDASATAGTEEGTSQHGNLDIASFQADLKGARTQEEILQAGLNNICQQVQAGQGALYLARNDDGKKVVELAYGFAIAVGESTAPHFEFGEGLIGQAAAGGKSLYLDEVPEGYITILSGLGTSSPRFLFVSPMKKGEDVWGIVEIATFSALTEAQRKRIEEMTQMLAEKIK